ncbi:hypothetical protein ES703_68558 [subsurface metagenome]
MILFPSKKFRRSVFEVKNFLLKPAWNKVVLSIGEDEPPLISPVFIKKPLQLNSPEVKYFSKSRAIFKSACGLKS